MTPADIAAEATVVDITPLTGSDPRLMAFAADRSVDAINDYLAGVRAPPADVLARMCAVAGIHPGECFRMPERVSDR